MEYFNILMSIFLVLTNSVIFDSHACLANKELPSNPIVINTWNFKSAGEAAWKVLQHPDSSALDAVQGMTQTNFQIIYSS